MLLTNISSNHGLRLVLGEDLRGHYRLPLSSPMGATSPHPKKDMRAIPAG
jgi:hypothetical protein